MRNLLLLCILCLGCSRPPDSIQLYPGYVVKSQGRIMWFPVHPEFDEREGMWSGQGAVEITSCISDPWPDEPGGKDAFVEVRNQEK